MKRLATASSTVTIIRPPPRWPGFALGDLWRHRAICLVLTMRSLKARYRQTIIGAAWTVLQPLLLVVVFTVFFGLFARAPSQGLPHAVFYFLGLLPWQIVARTLTEGSASVVANGALVTRVYFPRIYLPISTGITALVDLAFGTGALAALLFVFGVAPGIGVITMVPLLIVIALLSGLGVAFWLSALNAAYRDVAQLLPSITQVWFFASPIIYPTDIVAPDVRPLYYLNPMALVIDGFRSAFAGLPPPPPAAWLISSVVAVCVFVSGYLFFRHREPTFADVV